MIVGSGKPARIRVGRSGCFGSAVAIRTLRGSNPLRPSLVNWIKAAA